MLFNDLKIIDAPGGIFNKKLAIIYVLEYIYKI